jgi:hypothetical protein
MEKTNTRTTTDPGIPLLDIYLKGQKSTYNRDTYTLMFIEALFTIAKLISLDTHQ